jgi:hypothetical protein
MIVGAGDRFCEFIEIVKWVLITKILWSIIERLSRLERRKNCQRRNGLAIKALAKWILFTAVK